MNYLPKYFNFSELRLNLEKNVLKLSDLKSILNTGRTTDLSDVITLYTPTIQDVIENARTPQQFIVSCSFDSQPCSFK